MKRTTLLPISILLILSACSSPKSIPTATAIVSMTASPTQGIITSTPKPTNTPTFVEAAESWDALQPLINYDHSGIINTVSPDGQWIIADLSVSPLVGEPSRPINTNQVINIENSSITIDIEYVLPEQRLDTYRYSFDSWSPDGKSFIGVYYNEFNGSDFCCGDAVAISNIETGKADSHLFRWGWSEDPGIYWSDDSSKIGLALGRSQRTPGGFWIIDTQGNIILKTAIDRVWGAAWRGDTVYVMSHKDGYNLYEIDIAEKSTKLLSGFDKRADLIGLNNETNQLLIRFKYDDGSTNDNLWLFDLGSQKLDKLVDLPEKYYYYSKSSPSLHFVAFMATDRSLWIFDWQSRTLNYYGKINLLFGWVTNKNGFLVEAANKDIKIIRPQE